MLKGGKLPSKFRIYFDKYLENYYRYTVIVYVDEIGIF